MRKKNYYMKTKQHATKKKFKNQWVNEKIKKET